VTFKERLEQNPLFFLLTALFVGFTAGVATYRGVLEIAQLETVPRVEAERRAVESSSTFTSASRKPVGTATAPATLPPQLAAFSVVTNVSSSNFEPTMQVVRTRLSLRQLLPMETGRPLAAMPAGTFSFIYVHSVPRRSDHSDVFAARAYMRPQGHHYMFEVLKPLSAQPLLAVFCNEGDAATITALDARTRVVTLSPIPWGAANTLALLPVNQISTSQDRSIEVDGGEMSVLDVTLR
jgi:hypothetical protein